MTRIIALIVLCLLPYLAPAAALYDSNGSGFDPNNSKLFGELPGGGQAVLNIYFQPTMSGQVAGLLISVWAMGDGFGVFELLSTGPTPVVLDNWATGQLAGSPVQNFQSLWIGSNFFPSVTAGMTYNLRASGSNALFSLPNSTFATGQIDADLAGLIIPLSGPTVAFKLDGVSVQPATVPEPSTFVLLGFGLAGLVALSRRRLT